MNRAYFSNGLNIPVNQPKELRTVDASSILLQSQKASTSVTTTKNLMLSSNGKHSCTWRSNVFKNSNLETLPVVQEEIVNQESIANQLDTPIALNIGQGESLSDQKRTKRRRSKNAEEKEQNVGKEMPQLASKQQLEGKNITVPKVRQAYVRTIKVPMESAILNSEDKEASSTVPILKQISVTAQQTVVQEDIILKTIISEPIIIAPKLQNKELKKLSIKEQRTDAVNKINMKEEKDFIQKDKVEVEVKLLSDISTEKNIPNQKLITPKKEMINEIKLKNVHKKLDTKRNITKGKQKEIIKKQKEPEMKKVIISINKESYVRTIEAVVKNEILLAKEMKGEEISIPLVKQIPEMDIKISKKAIKIPIAKETAQNEGKIMVDKEKDRMFETKENEVLIEIKKENIPKKKIKSNIKEIKNIIPIQKKILSTPKNIPLTAEKLSDVNETVVPDKKLIEMKKNILKNPIKINKIIIFEVISDVEIAKKKLKKEGQIAKEKLKKERQIAKEKLKIDNLDSGIKKIYIPKIKKEEIDSLNVTENVLHRPSSAKNNILLINKENNIEAVKIAPSGKKIFILKSQSIENDKNVIENENEKEIGKRIEKEKELEVDNVIDKENKLNFLPERDEKVKNLGKEKKIIKIKENNQNGIMMKNIFDKNEIKIDTISKDENKEIIIQMKSKNKSKYEINKKKDIILEKKNKIELKNVPEMKNTQETKNNKTVVESEKFKIISDEKIDNVIFKDEMVKEINKKVTEIIGKENYYKNDNNDKNKNDSSNINVFDYNKKRKGIKKSPIKQLSETKISIIPINKGSYVHTIEAVKMKEILLAKDMKGEEISIPLVKQIPKIDLKLPKIEIKKPMVKMIPNKIEKSEVKNTSTKNDVSSNEQQLNIPYKNKIEKKKIITKSKTKAEKISFSNKVKNTINIVPSSLPLSLHQQQPMNQTEMKVIPTLIKKLSSEELSIEKISNAELLNEQKDIKKNQREKISGGANTVTKTNKKTKINHLVKTSTINVVNTHLKNSSMKKIEKLNIVKNEKLIELSLKKIKKTKKQIMRKIIIKSEENVIKLQPEIFRIKNVIEKLENISIFREVTSTLEKFDFYIKENINKLGVRDLSNLLFFLNRSSSIYIQLLNNYLYLISNRINELSLLLWEIIDISHVFYGIQSIKENDKNYLLILSNMNNIIINYLNDSKNVPRSLEVGIMFLGLQSNNGNTEESKKLLVQMNFLLQRCTNTFTPSDVRNVLCGLHKMKSDNVIILEILSTLSLKIKNISMNFTNQNICDCIHSLQGMKSDKLEVRTLISSLIPHINNFTIKIKESKNQINNQNLLFCMIGLQNMKNDNIELNLLLKSLLPLFKNCKDQYKKTKDISNLLYSLNGLNSNKIEVQNVIEYIIPLINANNNINNDKYKNDNNNNNNSYNNNKNIENEKNHNDNDKNTNIYNDNNDIDNNNIINNKIKLNKFSSLEVSRMIFGLSNFNGEIPIVRKLIKEILPFITNCNEKFLSNDINQLFYGLQNMSSHYSEIRELISVITIKIIKSPDNFHAKNLFPALSNLKNLSKIHIEVKDLSKILKLKIENCIVDKIIPDDDFFLSGLNVLEGLGATHTEIIELKSLLNIKLVNCKFENLENLEKFGKSKDKTEIENKKIDTEVLLSQPDTLVPISSNLQPIDISLDKLKVFSSVLIPLFDPKSVPISVPNSAPLSTILSTPISTPLSTPSSISTSPTTSESTPTIFSTSNSTSNSHSDSDSTLVLNPETKSVSSKIRKKITPSTFNPFSDENYFILVEKYKISEKKSFRYPFGQKEI